MTALGLPLSAGALTSCSGGVSDVRGGAGSGPDESGTGGSDTGGSDTGGSGGTAVEQKFGIGVCTDPQPLLEGHDTGFVRCAEGWLHRTEKKACPTSVPREQVLPPISETYDECQQDSDCPAEYGYCGPVGGGMIAYRLACNRGCIEDSDCASDEICLCGNPIGKCVPTLGCAVDDDCAGEAFCSGIAVLTNVCSEPQRVFDCESTNDQCRSPNDCEQGRCTAQRTCLDDEAVCGRPFLVESTERRAVPCERGDWLLDGEGFGTGPVDEGARQKLAAHWQRMGLMEHASIAAFARFALQLLGLGAPADLIEATNQALVDETRHARLCFALASHYAGRAIGPGPLELSGALDTIDPAEILRTVILEGCVGETLAALEARQAAEVARDPRVAKLLASIAEDEARHAQLAWRFVQWLLGERPELIVVADETFRAAVEGSSETTEDHAADVDLTAYGVVPRSRSRRLRREGLERVVIFCAQALLAQRKGAELERNQKAVCSRPEGELRAVRPV